jgi:hypothetical protein
MVGVARFELTTSSSRTKRATGLRYTPNFVVSAKVQIFCKNGVFCCDRFLQHRLRSCPVLFMAVCGMVVRYTTCEWRARFQKSGGPPKFLQQVVPHTDLVSLFFFIELQLIDCLNQFRSVISHPVGHI